ncbi:MAG: hypothetical protein R2882_01755 [Gemmatimonadales bacterium]
MLVPILIIVLAAGVIAGERERGRCANSSAWAFGPHGLALGKMLESGRRPPPCSSAAVQGSAQCW